jgi:hypothetical protein
MNELFEALVDLELQRQGLEIELALEALAAGRHREWGNTTKPARRILVRDGEPDISIPPHRELSRAFAFDDEEILDRGQAVSIRILKSSSSGASCYASLTNVETALPAV